MREVADRLHRLLKGRRTKITLLEIADHLDVSPRTVRRALSLLEEGFVSIHVDHEGALLNRYHAPSTPSTLPAARWDGTPIRFGVTADNHLGSRYARLDVLNALFDIWAGEGISTVYQLGNIIDGEAPFNRHDLIVHGIEGQTNYLIQEWPQRKGITTHFITGDDHEGWYIQREGLNIGRYIEEAATKAGRVDLLYLGHMEHDVKLGPPDDGINNFMRLTHPGGGSSYATSYAAQKWVEALQGGEKPSIALLGHYHKAEYGYPREVHILQAGTTQDPTPFMRKRRIQAHVGGWIVEVRLAADGHLVRFTSTWIPFYNRAFYDPNGQWEYRWQAIEKRRGK